MYEDEMFFAKLFLNYPAYLMSNHYDLYRQHGDSFSAKAIRKGDFKMGPGVPSPSRLIFLKWLLSYCEKNGHQAVGKLLRAQIRTQFGESGR